MKRLLCIVGGMNVGGAETFLMKVYRNLDKTQYQMDFAVSIEGDGTYDDEIKALGGKIYHITPKSKGVIKNFCDIKKLVKKEQYKYVLRTSQHSLSAMELLAAKFGGAKVRVYRSSNSNTASVNKKQLWIHRLCSFMPKWFANVRIAPSTEAAEFMFGKECVKKGSAKIINNGVDLSVYRYDKNSRMEIRQELGIPDAALLVGHVGRFNQQKNHIFLLEVFKSILNINGDAFLLLVGKGELEKSIRERAQMLGLEGHIIFAGVRSDIPSLLSAMDVFVMPSFYEGMPNTIIEAQATGLPCVIADTITKEANITGLVEYLSLEEDLNTWSKKIQGFYKNDRCNTKQSFLEHRYDIQNVTKEFVATVFK